MFQNKQVSDVRGSLKYWLNIYRKSYWNLYRATGNLDADKDDFHIQEEDVSDGNTINDDYDERLSLSVSKSIDEMSQKDLNANSAGSYISSPDTIPRETYESEITESSDSKKPASSESSGVWSSLQKMFEWHLDSF